MPVMEYIWYKDNVGVFHFANKMSFIKDLIFITIVDNDWF